MTLKVGVSFYFCKSTSKTSTLANMELQTLILPPVWNNLKNIQDSWSFRFQMSHERWRRTGIAEKRAAKEPCDCPSCLLARFLGHSRAPMGELVESLLGWEVRSLGKPRRPQFTGHITGEERAAQREDSVDLQRCPLNLQLSVDQHMCEARGRAARRIKGNNAQRSHRWRNTEIRRTLGRALPRVLSH